MDALTFKDVGPEDEAALVRLFTSVRAEELGADRWQPELRERMLRFQLDAQRRGYRKQSPGAREHLILRDGVPVGWIIVDRSGAVMRCLDVAIVSEERNRGIGTQVFRALQKEAAEADRPLGLMVLRTNHRAFAFYSRLGFRETGETGIHALMEWRP